MPVDQSEKSVNSKEPILYDTKDSNLKHQIDTLREGSSTRWVHWSLFGKVGVKLADIILRCQDWLEGRVQLPRDDIGPLDVLEEGVGLDGISIRSSTTQSLWNLSLQQFSGIHNFSFSFTPNKTYSYLMRSRASGVRYGGRFSFPFKIFSIVFFLKISWL